MFNSTPLAHVLEGQFTVAEIVRKLTAHDLIGVMEKLESECGLPAHIHSDNGYKFVAKVVQRWLAQRHVKMLYMELGNPWQKGHIESVSGSLRDECLKREPMFNFAKDRVPAED